MKYLMTILLCCVTTTFAGSYNIKALLNNQEVSDFIKETENQTGDERIELVSVKDLDADAIGVKCRCNFELLFKRSIHTSEEYLRFKVLKVDRLKDIGLETQRLVPDIQITRVED